MLDDVILRRESTRRFAVEPISFSQLSSILEVSASPIPSDFLGAGGSRVRVKEHYRKKPTGRVRKCGRCGGTGKDILGWDNCTVCGGKGWIRV